MSIHILTFNISLELLIIWIYFLIWSFQLQLSLKNIPRFLILEILSIVIQDKHLNDILIRHQYTNVFESCLSSFLNYKIHILLYHLKPYDFDQTIILTYLNQLESPCHGHSCL